MDEMTRGVDRTDTDRAEFRETPRQLWARQTHEEDQLQLRHLTECYEHARAGIYGDKENPFPSTSDRGIMWHAGMVMGRCELNVDLAKQEVDSADDAAEERNETFRQNRRAMLQRNEGPK